MTPAEALEKVINYIFCRDYQHWKCGEAIEKLPPELREPLKDLTSADTKNTRPFLVKEIK